ncbi:MAG TPA: hypothetical protein VF193_12030 [Steroidobacter sp.]
MSRHERKALSRVSYAVAAAIALAPAAAFPASCPVNLDDVKAKISSFASRTDSEESGVKQDYEAASSKDYAKKFFDTFEQLNKAAKDSTQLVNTAYNLAGYTAPLPEGKIQTSLPPKVTLSMSNAMELAKAAADEDSTKIDIAQLRCNQNVEDAALAAALDQLDSNTVSRFKSAKTKACKVVHVLADLQDKKQKLDQIRTNGYPLFFLHAKDTKEFGDKKRTIQLKADLRMYPIYPKNVADGKDQPFLLGKLEGIDLSYNSYFKFSDNNWSTLNLYQYFIDDTDEDEVCYPKIKLTSSVKVATCVRVTDKDKNWEWIKVKVRAKYWYNDASSAVSLGERKIPAPFGYLAQISNMKEKKMQDLKSKAVKRVSSMLGEYGEMIEKAQQWKESCSG